MISVEDFRALRGAPQRWLPTVAEICARHGLPAEDIRVAGGSSLVASAGGGTIVKIIPPFMRVQWEAERLALVELHGRLPLATPRLLHQGKRDGWPYLVMTKLSGTSVEDIWPAASEAERIDLLGQIGALIAEVQRVPPGPLAGIEPRWGDLIAEKLAGCEARHRRLGMPEHLLQQLGPYLDRARAALPSAFKPVILTGEYTPGNLFAEARGGRWILTGLFDFGDVMVGPAEYDLLGPSTFLAAGRSERVRSLFAGAGMSAEHGPELRERLMVMLLLHRFSDLGVQIAVEGWRERAQSFDQLADLLWPFG
jgi:hygromycin-B 7''-O-kinase